MTRLGILLATEEQRSDDFRPEDGVNCFGNLAIRDYRAAEISYSARELLSSFRTKRSEVVSLLVVCRCTNHRLRVSKTVPLGIRKSRRWPLDDAGAGRSERRLR